MLFRILPKDQWDRLVDIMLGWGEVIGPRQIASDRYGRPVHQYLPVNNPGELDLAYETTQYSAKTYFLPFQETLSEYRFADGDWDQEINYRLQPRAIIGLHACDIHALLKLDKVFIKSYFPSPYYVSRRQNTFIVGIDHDPCEGGFCRSLGTDTVTHGFDLFLTDLDDRYFVTIDSDRGYTALQQVHSREVTEADTKEYLEVRHRIAEGFETKIDAHNLSNLLDIEFESDVWKKWGDMCLGCGSCAMVCPTCYCYGVTEELALDGASAKRIKQLYSCNFVDFARVAGGHNFRPDRETRLKYRYYHQHRGFVEAFEEPKCVGCNRCGRVCPAGITPPEVIKDLQNEKRP
jgi:formate hydrogenlyase subunit 6/NADH:ubiquinone oxidoreductase subunit I